MITMNEQYSLEEFFDLVETETNPFDPNASIDGKLFETYGPEYAYVCSITATEPHRVWTLLDNNDGEEPFVSMGWHFVNRLGYFIEKTV